MYLGLQGSGTVFGAQDVDVDRVFNRVWERKFTGFGFTMVRFEGSCNVGCIGRVLGSRI